MKSRIYILLMISLLASCQLESYIGYTEEIYESAPVLVSVGSSPNTQTKASGSIDTEDIWKWKDSRIYIYSFVKDAGFDALSTDGTGRCLIDGAAEGNANAGRAANITDAHGYVLWDAADKAPYYPAGFDAYEFFAYYIDDCVVDDADIVRSEESVTMPITITGAQDIMTAKAELKQEHLDSMGFTVQQKETILNSYYSAYSANNGVHPELYFSHHLVKLTFEAYTARPEAVDVTIQEVSVKSRTEALFTALHRDSTMLGLDFSSDTDMESVFLMERDYKSILQRDKYRLSWREGDENLSVYDRKPHQIGGSLLVAPEELYDCSIFIKGKDMDNIPYELKIRSADGVFVPGNHYVVRLAVYGKFAIECDVVVLDWADGGSYDIDVI